MLIFLALLGVLLSNLAARVEANLAFGSKATKRLYNHASCTVRNTTYEHGQTFKLDCKTQCVCENGRHACSSLCPNEQLPAPEDTISCRSPRLVEVPGHCCKMWLCENPTADVYATCHNASSSPWTPCSQNCGMGISTRFTSTRAGCRQLSNLRLCENRKCDYDNTQFNKIPIGQNSKAADNPTIAMDGQHGRPTEHRIRKGHECRSIQRLGPARIRIGACISRKLYRPKLCGRCHHATKCCVPSVSTTIQVELLCPLNAEDPIRLVRHEQQQTEKQKHEEHPSLAANTQLWDTVSLEPIDQEYLQSHQIQIENKFIAVEWILKCECSRNFNCNANKSENNSNSNGNNNDSYQNNDMADTTPSNSIAETINSHTHGDDRYDPAPAPAPAPAPYSTSSLTSSLSLWSGEQLPDIIPYPPNTNTNTNKNNKNKNNRRNHNKKNHRNTKNDMAGKNDISVDRNTSSAIKGHGNNEIGSNNNNKNKNNNNNNSNTSSRTTTKHHHQRT